MNNIRVKNIRSLEDTGIIKLTPLTVLLGKNSSGKSTFLRLFPLFKQSWNTKNRGALALYGDFIDFGEFSTLKTTNIIDDFIELCFDINISKINRFAYMFWEEKNEKKISCNCDLKIKKMDNSDLLYCSEMTIKVNRNVVRITLDQNGKIFEFYVNSESYSSCAQEMKAIYSGNSICFPVFIDDNDLQKKKNYSPYPQSFVKPILDLIKELSLEKDFEIYNYIDILPFSDKETFIKILKTKNRFAKQAKPIVKHLLSEDGDKCFNAILFAQLPGLLENIKMHLFMISQNIFYSKPLRANAQRYYRSQSLAVDEISPDGSNLAAFIVNMNDAQKSRFNEWTLTNFGFAIHIHKEAGHQSVYLEELDGQEQYNVTDMGFGFSQIIPIITQLWDISTKENNSQAYRCNDFIYAIEQPELHLHPALQAKTLNLFTKVIYVARENKINLQIIIETHSETMINYLGKLIAAKRISNDDVSLLIFEKKSSCASTSIKLSNYDENGVLNNWPFGFFSVNEGLL